MENWHEALKYLFWNAVLSSILFIAFYYPWISEMPASPIKFVLVYGISLITGILGAMIAMVFTGVNKIERKKWKQLLFIPLLYTILVIAGALNIIPLDFSKSVVQNILAIFLIIVFRLCILILSKVVN